MLIGKKQSAGQGKSYSDHAAFDVTPSDSKSEEIELDIGFGP